MAIKLWPGAQPFSGLVEAAINAARKANVTPDEVARILVAGRNRTTVGRQPASEGPGRGDPQPAVLRRLGRGRQGFHLGPCHRGEVFDPASPG